MLKDKIIENHIDLETVLDQIKLVNTVLDFDWHFNWKEINVEGRIGWFVWVSFKRPDTETNKCGIGRGRDEIIWQGTTTSGVVKTCWLLVELVVRHELMEGFRWQGKRIFNPHNSVVDLASIQN
jgi:hypothetical protein